MGEVYLANDTLLDRRVVLKCVQYPLPKNIARSPDLANEVRARFAIEARALASLNHPFTCTLYDADLSDGFLVIEYIDGLTLVEAARKARLSYSRILEIALEIAESVADAHKKKIVHRDLKPANIMLAPSGHIKVLDFGLAKLISEPGFTAFPRIMGTPNYRSPEQERDPSSVDERTDVFALGVIIYQLVTGQFPYPETFIVNREPPQPSAFTGFNCAAWPALEDVLCTALHLNPADRYRDAGAMLAELRRVLPADRHHGPGYCFVDTQVLIDNICPPEPGSETRRRRLTELFDRHVSLGAAVTSSLVIDDLFEAVAQIYFDGDSQAWPVEVREPIEAAKERVVSYRRRNKKENLPRWGELPAEEKEVFIRSAPVLEKKLNALFSRLTVAPYDNAVFSARRHDYYCEDRLPAKDATVLADARALSAPRVISDKGRFLRAVDLKILRVSDDYLYEFSDAPADLGPSISPGSGLKTVSL
jgi:serine/threonine protein kinase